MNTNDCLRQICSIAELNESELIAVFELGGKVVSKAQIVAWLSEEDDPVYQACCDTLLGSFLDGLIVHRRGAKEGTPRAPETIINNNVVFRKLKIAFNLQADEVLSILSQADLHISKHELSAFFRRANHKRYRDCDDQVLCSFLKGLAVNYRDAPGSSGSEPEEPE